MISKKFIAGLVIGTVAGLAAGIYYVTSKTQKIDTLKGKLTDLAAETRERINNLMAIADQYKSEETRNQ